MIRLADQYRRSVKFFLGGGIMIIDFNILAGGEKVGQGVQSVGMILAKTMAQGGLHVLADQDYENRVR